MSKRHCRVDKRAVSPSRPLLKVEKERGTAKQATLTIPEKHCRAPLRTAQSPGLKTTRIGKPREAWGQFDRTRVIKTLKYLDDGTRKPEGSGQRAHTAAVRIEIGSEINKEISSRTIPRIDVDWRKATDR